jgi:hypothetical protein
MLKIIRRVFSFQDWTTSHPNTPPPGDMLDAQFDEIIDQIDGWDQRVKSAIRHDGKIAAHAVLATSLAPSLIEELAGKFKRQVADDTEAAAEAANVATSAVRDAARLQAEAISVSALATQTADLVIDARGQAMARLEQLSREVEQNLAEVRQLAASVRGIESDFQNATPVAQDWAEASWMWAEWLDESGGGDNSLPDNAVKIMDLTGDHWSARWWANYAARAVQQKLLVQGQVSRYLYYATAGQTIYTGIDYYGQQLTVDWTSNAVQVFVNGVLKIPVRDYNAASQPPNQLILVTAPATGSPVELIVTKPFTGSGAPAIRVKRLKTSTWSFTGAGTSFPLINAADDTPITPGTGKDHQVLVSLNGNWQAAIRDYTISTSNIVFVNAPEADALAFGIVLDDSGS